MPAAINPTEGPSDEPPDSDSVLDQVREPGYTERKRMARYRVSGVGNGKRFTDALVEAQSIEEVLAKAAARGIRVESVALAEEPMKGLGPAKPSPVPPPLPPEAGPRKPQARLAVAEDPYFRPAMVAPQVRPNTIRCPNCRYEGRPRMVGAGCGMWLLWLVSVCFAIMFFCMIIPPFISFCMFIWLLSKPAQRVCMACGYPHVVVLRGGGFPSLGMRELLISVPAALILIPLVYFDFTVDRRDRGRAADRDRIAPGQPAEASPAEREDAEKRHREEMEKIRRDGDARRRALRLEAEQQAARILAEHERKVQERRIAEEEAAKQAKEEAKRAAWLAAEVAEKKAASYIRQAEAMLRIGNIKSANEYAEKALKTAAEGSDSRTRAEEILKRKG